MNTIARTRTMFSALPQSAGMLKKMNTRAKSCKMFDVAKIMSALLMFGALVTGLSLGITTATAASSHFLTAPYTDSGVKLQQGWYYDYSNANHQGIDYIKGTVDKSATWQSFQVKAAAPGTAKYAYSSSWGNYVLIKHVVGTDTYYTLYAHLASSPLVINKWQTVTRGQYIGMAGKTGAANNVIHLHFEFSKGGYGSGYRLDPYSIYSTKKNYPPFTSYRDNDYWFRVPYAMPIVT